MGVAAILVMWPRPHEQTFVPPSHWGSMWNLALIGPAVLEKIFENSGRTDNGRTDDRPWLYYKLTNEHKGSGELKIFFSRTQRPMTLKLGTQHWVLEYYQDCSNDDPGLTLTYFRQCQIWLLYGKNVKQWIFQKLL